MGVTVEGDREILGIWWQQTEGAKFWLAVLNELHRRGVADVLIACVDGLAGFPEAIAAVFPHAWTQTCIVHLIRSSMRYVAYRDRKRVAADLKAVYRAVDADHAQDELAAFDAKWGASYPMIAEAWRARWEHVIPFLALPEGLRRSVYTTNSIEGLNRQIRKSIKNRVVTTPSVRTPLQSLMQRRSWPSGAPRPPRARRACRQPRRRREHAPRALPARRACRHAAHRMGLLDPHTRGTVIITVSMWPRGLARVKRRTAGARLAGALADHDLDRIPSTPGSIPACPAPSTRATPP